MTINKEQAVSDAIERIVEEIAVHDETRHEGMIGHGLVYVRADDLRTILAASHPLEQQQAVSGDVVERLVREFEKIQGYKGDEHRTMARAALTASGMGTWQPIETAPKDGTWLLVRGRNAANYPMIPVVCAWRHGEGGGQHTWRDSAGLRDMSHLISDVPPDGSADWMPLPEPRRQHYKHMQ